MLETIGVAFGLVFISELGDKSQLTAALFATRYKSSHVLVSIGVATGLLMLISVSVGELIATSIPQAAVGVAAGLLFIAFGVKALVETAEPEETGDERVDGGARSPFVTMASTFFLAEFGDKTMIAAMSLAATRNAAAVWVGATVGMFLADALAVVAARLAGDRLPRDTISRVAGILFVVLGLVLLYGTL